MTELDSVVANGLLDRDSLAKNRLEALADSALTAREVVSEIGVLGFDIQLRLGGTS